MTDLSCFKAYDIRGKVPDPLSPELAFALGRAVAEHFAARRVVLGYDARLSGPVLHAALAAGLHQAGARVFSLGMCGTEEIYDAAHALFRSVCEACLLPMTESEFSAAFDRNREW